VRTPASLPRIQNEPVVRLLAADLVAPENAREGLQAMRAEIEEALTQVQVAQERFVPEPTPYVAPDVLLREHGLRVTRPRLAVLTALAEAPHSGADAVTRAVRLTTEVSTQAVYDVLHTLADRGLEALAAWARSPAALPRIQNEPVVRLLAADLVEPAAVLEGLETLRADLDHAQAGVEAGERLASELSHRAHLLEVNHTYADRMLALQREWLEEAERVLSGGRSRSSRSPS